MTSHQEDKITMGLTVQATCNRYPAVTAQIPAFVTALGDMGVKIQYIQGQAQIQAGKITGFAQNKKLLKKAMCQKTFELSSAISSYAATAKNATLAGKVNFTLTALLETRDTEIGSVCENIRTEATTNLVALADYAVTAADLTDLAQKIGAYKEALVAPADAKVSKSTATTNIANAFPDFDSILANRMDPLMPKFKLISADFVTDYTKARNIVDSGGGSATPPTPPVPPTK